MSHELCLLQREDCSLSDLSIQTCSSDTSRRPHQPSSSPARDSGEFVQKLALGTHNSDSYSTEAVILKRRTAVPTELGYISGSRLVFESPGSPFQILVPHSTSHHSGRIPEFLLLTRHLPRWGRSSVRPIPISQIVRLRCYLGWSGCGVEGTS